MTLRYFNRLLFELQASLLAGLQISWKSYAIKLDGATRPRHGLKAQPRSRASLMDRRRRTRRGLSLPAEAKPLPLIGLLREGSLPKAGTATARCPQGIEPAPVARSATGLAKNALTMYG